MQRAVVVIVVLLIVALLGLALYGVCSPKPDGLACVRDVAIIVIALEVSVGILIMALMFAIFAILLYRIDTQIQPILKEAQQTAATVQGTTRFVSDAVVAPIISVAGFVAAVKGTFKAVVGLSKRKKGGG